MATFSIDLITGKPYLFSGDFTNSGMTTFSGVTSVVNGLSMVTSRQAKLGGILNYSTILTKGAGNTAGVEYGGDYSASYSNRSLVDKQYVDNKVSGSTPSWNTLTNRPAWLTGATLSAFQLAHSHSQYLTNTNFNVFTGTTLPANYYNKTQINSYTGGTASAIGNKLDKTTFSTYTGTTAPGQFASKSFVSNYTGVTVPSTYVAKSVFNLYTGTTAPSQFASKAFVSNYTGVTVPSTYVAKSVFQTYTGTTAPNQFASKANAITGATNLGSGSGIYTSVASNKLQLRSLKGAGNISISTDGTSITISGTSSGIASWNTLTDKPAWLSGSTLQKFQTGHTHSYNNLTNKLTAGLGISIINNIVSATGGGGTGGTTTLQLLDISGGTNVNTIAATPITWTTQVFSGTSLSFTGGSRIYVQASGIYDISYVLNVINADNSIKNIGSSVRKNGNIDITPLSSGSISIDMTSNTSTNSLPHFLIALSSGDYLEVMAFRIGNDGVASTKANSSWLEIKRIS